MDTDFLKPDDTIKPLVHSLKIGIFQCEPIFKGRITFINLAGASILGCTSPEELLNTYLCDYFVEPQDYTNWFTELEQAGIQTDFETLCKRKDGKKHIIGITSNLILDAKGKWVRIDGLIRDIHVSKKGQLVKDVIANINKILVSNLNMREVDHLICDELYKIIEWDRVSITLIEDRGDVVVDFMLTRDHKKKMALSKTLPEKSHYPLIGSIVEKVIITGKPYIIRDTSIGEVATDAMYAKEGIRSRLAYPLKFKDKVIGSINFGCSKLDYYGEEHIRLLEKIAPSLTFGIENTKLYERAIKAEEGYKELSKTFDSPWM